MISDIKHSLQNEHHFFSKQIWLVNNRFRILLAKRSYVQRHHFISSVESKTDELKTIYYLPIESSVEQSIRQNKLHR